jgi:hypothetical protein
MRKENELQAVEMKFLRGILEKTGKLEVGHTAYIRGELKMEEIQNQIKESRLRWLGDIK